MDVRMPDGTVITNVPDDISQSALLKMVNNTKMSSPDVFSETASEQSGIKNLMAGIGGGMKGLALGAGQRLGIVDQSTVDNHLRVMKGLESTGWGTAGSILGTAAALAPAALIPGANTALGATMIGAGSGALNPTAQDESIAVNMALGGVGGLGGRWVGNKIGSLLAGRKNIPSAANSASQASSSGGAASASTSVSGGATAAVKGGGAGYGSVGDDVSAGLTATQQEIRKIGDGLGFKLTPGKASGSKALQQMESKLASQPMTSGTFNAIDAGNQKVLNRIAAKSIGETSDTVDSAVLQQAQERIGNVYKMVADKKPRMIDPDEFLAKLSKVENDFEGLAKVADNPLVNKFMTLASKGQATGEQLQDLASKMGRAAHNEMTSRGGDRQVGMALNQIKTQIDDLLESGLSGDTLKSFQTARQQYRNLMLLTERTGVVNPSSGNVSGGSLAQMLQQKDKPGFLFGKNESDLYNAARWSQAFKPIVGDSGTATRSMVANPTDYVLSLPFSLATRAYTSSPVVHAVANANAVAANGLMPNAAGAWLGPRMGQAGLVAGGLLGQAQ